MNESLALLHGMAVLSLIFSTAILDAWRQRIPNAICACGFGAGLFLSYCRGGFWPTAGSPVALGESLLAAGIAFALFYMVYRLGGLGAGDVKLIAALGALGNLRFILWTLLHTALAGAPLALFFLWQKGCLRKGLRQTVRGFWRWRYRALPVPAETGKPTEAEEDDAPVTLPYAVAICAGSLWTIWWMVRRGEQLPFL